MHVAIGVDQRKTDLASGDVLVKDILVLYLKPLGLMLDVMEYF